MLTDPRAILTALQTALEAMRLPDAFTPVDSDPLPAFEAVKIYDLDDLNKALQELLVFKSRCAFILLEDSAHDSSLAGRIMTTKRTVNITVLVSDRNWSNRNKALMGDEKTPGALLLGHLLVMAIAGERSNFLFEPGSGELFALQGKERDIATGRIAWRQEFKVPAGTLAMNVSREAVR